MGNSRDLRLAGVHVLVVDDYEDARYVLASYLKHHGASVVTAQSGAEALAILTKVRAHVIVSDLSMPGMTGIEFLRGVRSLPDQKQNPTPAIAVTAFGMQHQQAALEGGFQVFLTKPVDPLRVVNEVERLWRLSQVQFRPE